MSKYQFLYTGIGPESVIPKSSRVLDVDEVDDEAAVALAKQYIEFWDAHITNAATEIVVIEVGWYNNRLVAKVSRGPKKTTYTAEVTVYSIG